MRSHFGLLSVAGDKLRLAHLKKHAAQIKVRIDVLSLELRACATQLEDPGLSPRKREQLAAEFDNNHKELEQLTESWEDAQSQIDPEQPDARSVTGRITPMALRDRLGHRLQRIRTQKNVSQDVLARRTGNPRQVIVEIERGVRSPTIETLAAIANALDVTLSDLFADVDSTLPLESNRIGALLAGRSPEMQIRLLAAVEALLPFFA